MTCREELKALMNKAAHSLDTVAPSDAKGHVLAALGLTAEFRELSFQPTTPSKLSNRPSEDICRKLNYQAELVPPLPC